MYYVVEFKYSSLKTGMKFCICVYRLQKTHKRRSNVQINKKGQIKCEIEKHSGPNILEVEKHMPWYSLNILRGLYTSSASLYMLMFSHYSPDMKIIMYECSVNKEKNCRDKFPLINSLLLEKYYNQAYLFNNTDRLELQVPDL